MWRTWVLWTEPVGLCIISSSDRICRSKVATKLSETWILFKICRRSLWIPWRSPPKVMLVCTCESYIYLFVLWDEIQANIGHEKTQWDRLFALLCVSRYTHAAFQMHSRWRGFSIAIQRSKYSSRGDIFSHIESSHIVSFIYFVCLIQRESLV